MSWKYIRLAKINNDPVWGHEVIDWVTTDLLRCYRNKSGNFVFEWVGNPSAPVYFNYIKQDYPIVIRADQKAQLNR